MAEKDVRYFDQPSIDPIEPGRFISVESLEPLLELAPGITSRPLVGSNLMGSFVRYEPDSVAPLHSHIEEQLFLVLEGEIELELSGVSRVMQPGDAALIPAWVPHSAKSGSGGAHQLDVFSPPRQAMLDLIDIHTRKT